jgi:hypothetical protein
MIESTVQNRSAAATGLGAVDVVIALTFFGFALLHTGLDVPLGFATLEEPHIVPATIVESLCGLALAWSAAALFLHRASAPRTALTAHSFALAGVLLGIVAGRSGGSTESNTIYHIVMLVVLVLCLGTLLSARGRASLGGAGVELTGANTAGNHGRARSDSVWSNDSPEGRDDA